MSKHDWVLSGGTGDWEVWECPACGRRTIPTPFGFIWPWPRCYTPKRKALNQIRQLCELATTTKLGRLTKSAEGAASLGQQILNILDRTGS